MWAASLKIPTLDSFSQRQVIESTKIYDKTGEILLYDVNQDIKRTVVPFEKISINARNATIAIEDKGFYEHGGVDVSSFFRAVVANIFSLSFSQGGSTITQQVVKNSLLTKEKRISRKLKEWVLAVKLEKILTKDEILNLYLNEIPYGGAIYGIEEASQTFFGVPASDLSLAQAAYLAALPQAPSFYSPFGQNVDRLNARKNLVLQEMLKNNFISEDQFNKAKQETVIFKPREEKGIKAPHFVFYIINELEKKYGEETVRNNGLKVITTLDYSIQQKGEEIAQKFAESNKKNFNAENDAFVVIDPNTGGILSMVGSRNYFDKDIDGNFNIATAHRQPGSTFKPFVYAEAFNKGYTPETVLFDIKTQFSTSCSPDNTTSLNGCYSPENYDGKFRGPMTLREALAQSINIPSVKALYLAGIKDSITLAKKMGIQSLTNANQYGLTLVLGGGEVSLLDMTSAYGVFATGGTRHPYNSILKVEDRDEQILEEYAPQEESVLSEKTAASISSILSDNIARTPGYGANSPLYFNGRDVAVKTGTTNDYKDAWIIGYTPSVVLGAWAGNNNNTPMEKKVAGLIVAPMWREYMDFILTKIPNETFTPPTVDDSFVLKPVLRGKWKGGISHLIDTISGKNATEFTPKETIEERLSGGIHSILYWVQKEDPNGPKPENPNNDPQFTYWEYALNRWLIEQGIPQPSEPTLPQGFDSIHTEGSKPIITILSPQNETVSVNDTITVSAQYKTSLPLKEVRFYMNGSYIGKSEQQPFSISFIPSNFPYSQSNTIKIVAFDTVFNSGEKETTFSLTENQ